MRLTSVILIGLICFSLPTRAQIANQIATAAGTVGSQAPARYQGSASTTVSLTLYHALTGKDGKEYYIDRNGNQYLLPGAGTNDAKTLSVYTGCNGQRWYVDKTGQSIDLPPQPPAPQVAQVETPSQSASDSSFQIDGQNIDSASPANVTVNNYNSSDNDGGANLASGVAAGAMLAAGIADAVDGIPYGYPLYVGGAGWQPYYWGADGYRHYIDRNLANQAYFHDWANNWKWYHGQVGTLGGRYYNQAHPVAYNNAFDHPHNLTPRDLSHNLGAPEKVAQLDDHGYEPIADRGDRAGIEHSGNLLNQARGDFDRGNFGDRFGDRGFGDRGFGDRGFGGRGFGGGFRGGGRR